MGEGYPGAWQRSAEVVKGCAWVSRLVSWTPSDEGKIDRIEDCS